MQFAILAQSRRQMSQTDRILPRYFLLRVRISIRPRYFLNAKTPKTTAAQSPTGQRHRPSERRNNLNGSLYLHARWRDRPRLGRAVDNALNVIQSVANRERGRHYRSQECCSVRITCTVAANIFFKCKFENFLIVVSTMCPHIKVAEFNTLSDGKGITGIHIAICQ